MRKRLQTMSAPKAMQMLHQIKVGELNVNGKMKTMVTRVTAEQKKALPRPGVKPIPTQFPASKL